MRRYWIPVLLAIYTLLLLAAAVEVRAQTPPPSPVTPLPTSAAESKKNENPEMTVEEAIQRIENAAIFATGGIGFSGQRTPATNAFHFLRTHEKGAESFRILLKSSRPETQMFALLGLTFVARAEAIKAYPAFENSEATVKVAHGCMLSTVPVSQIVVALSGRPQKTSPEFVEKDGKRVYTVSGVFLPSLLFSEVTPVPAKVKKQSVPATKATPAPAPPQ